MSPPPRCNQSPGLSAGDWLLVPLGFAIGGVVLFWFNPGQYAFYPFCTFYRATGLLCPGCGTLRALHQLLHGHLLAAFRFNALFVLGLAVAPWFTLQWARNRVGKAPHCLTVPAAWLWGALAVLVLFGVLRNLPFAHSAWLAP